MTLLSPERYLKNTEELLLVCSQKDLTESLKKKAITLIQEGLYWQRFSGLAMRGGGGVTFSVYNALRKITPPAQIPQSVLDRFRSACLFIISKTTYQYTELLNLLGLFAEKKIPVVPLKGAVLAKRVYGDVAARGISADFDLLIEAKNKESARILLEELGYLFYSEAQTTTPRAYFFLKSEVANIDLHWDLTSMCRSKERMEGFWKGTRLVKEDGMSYYEFKEEELLLYLSGQMFGNYSFIELRYTCDIHQLLHKYRNRLNWSQILEKAERWKLSSSLYAALKLSRELFDSDLPAGVLERLRPSPLKIILLKLFVNKKVVLGKGVNRWFLDNFLSYIFFELIEAKSVKDYFFIVVPPKEIRDKHWSARITRGVSVLSRKLFRRSP